MLYCCHVYTLTIHHLKTTNSFLHSLSGFIWTTFEDFGLGSDLMGIVLVNIFFKFWLHMLDIIRSSDYVKLS